MGLRDTKRITGHAGRCLLNPLGTGFQAFGTPCVPFGDERAEITAWLNQEDSSGLGAVDAVRQGEGDACRNHIKCGMRRSRRTRVAEIAGIKAADLSKAHTTVAPVPSQFPWPQPLQCNHPTALS